jgi:hypothetical protein
MPPVPGPLKWLQNKDNFGSIQFAASSADKPSMLNGFVYLVMLSSSAQALTRVPAPGTGEASLLYWRYLCRSQPQTETQPQASARKPQSESSASRERRELSCPLQHWKVRTHPGEDKVVEVVEDAS